MNTYIFFLLTRLHNVLFFSIVQVFFFLLPSLIIPNKWNTSFYDIAAIIYPPAPEMSLISFISGGQFVLLHLKMHSLIFM